MPQRRHGPVLWIASVGVLVLVVLGVIIAVHAHSSDRPSAAASSSHSIATLRAVLDKVPLPPGATLRNEQADPQKGDANAFVQRRYDLAVSPASSQQIEAALTRGNCQVVDLATGATSPVTTVDWATQVTPTSGDLWILPPGIKGGGVEVAWKGTALFVSVKGGDAEPS